MRRGPLHPKSSGGGGGKALFFVGEGGGKVKLGEGAKTLPLYTPKLTEGSEN